MLVLAPHPSTRGAATVALKQAGASAHGVATAQEALPLIVLERPDAVVCELDLAIKPDALDWLASVRALPEEREARVPAIAIVAREALRDARLPSPDEGGFDDYLEAPMVPAVLVSRLRALVERKKAA